MKGSSPSSAAAAAPNPPAAKRASPRTPDARTRFTLAGRSVGFDPRLDAVRSDIADIAMSDRLFAPHYAVPLERACRPRGAMVHGQPSRSAQAVTQLLPGEAFHAVDLSGGWAWGYCGHDHYVGYVETAALVEPVAATHVVDHQLALVFDRPDIRATVAATLPIGARVSATAADDYFATPTGYIHWRHVRRIGDLARDPVAMAQRLIDAPYLWGGRGDGGFDCSGLVQTVFAFAGVALPRDSDQQAAFGPPVDDAEPLRRGDLVFFPGHVAIMVDTTRIIHASAHWMSVAVEPLADLIARSEPVQAHRRVLP